MVDTKDFAICVACGTQFDVPLSDAPKGCKICDDPRQYVPATGQAWTSLAKLKSEGFHNVWKQDDVDKRVWFIQSEPKTGAGLPDVVFQSRIRLEPKVGIGQRAIFLQTEHGNVVWDLVPYIDDEFVKIVQEKGGLKAIVISHPHFYNTHLEWAKAFDCPVYISIEDQEWLCRADDPRKPVRKFITGSTEEILPDVKAIKAGGHFPGSLTLLWDKKLLHADTIMAAPSGLYHVDRPPGTTSYSFMWSYPNMIPLPPSAVYQIWKALEPFDFETTHGGFPGQDIRAKDVKKRVLESMQIWVRTAGHGDHEILEETCK